MYRLEHPGFLYALLLIPVFILIYIFILRWRRKAVNKFGDRQVVNRLMPETSIARKSFKFFLVMLAFAFLVFGMANPQIGSKLEKVERKGVDIVIALDVSNSMLARDIRPNRLVRAKYAISKMIDKMVNDRIGLVIFAGKAYKQLPITTDYAAAKMFLETVNTDMVPTQGTSIGSAIELSTTSFNLEEETKNKVIIVITDGENHEDNALQAAKTAAEKGIVIHTIGMGLPQGAPIPIMRGDQVVGYKQNNSGQTVVSKLNEQMLKELASIGNGAYVRATNARAGLKTIMNEIDKMEKKKFETKMFADYEDRFYYFIAAALLLMIIEVLLFEKKSKWIQKLNLFNTGNA
jgi:Ca-activated chloride channel family protein